MTGVRTRLSFWLGTTLVSIAGFATAAQAAESELLIEARTTLARNACMTSDAKALIPRLQAAITYDNATIFEAKKHLDDLDATSANPKSLGDMATGKDEELSAASLEAATADKAAMEHALADVKALPACTIDASKDDDGIPIDARASYTDLDPSAGGSATDISLGGQISLPVFDANRLDLSVGYQHVSGVDDNSYSISAALRFGSDMFQWGPTLGFQSNNFAVTSTETYNYGVFAKWSANDWFTTTAHIGGFEENTSLFDNSGIYGGLSANFYPCPNFAVRPHFEYTHFNEFGGFNEADVGVQGEYQLTQIGSTPLSAFVEYNHTSFPGGGGFHVDSIGAGLTLHFDGAPTLTEQDQNMLDPLIEFSPLSLRF